MGLGDAALTNIQLCGVVAVACAAWNLFGDLYFIDFYLAHMDFEGFGTIDRAPARRRGRLFNFDADSPWQLRLAQAGGWMYPVWALATTYPLYVGLSAGKRGWDSSGLAPCALLAYGLCVVGGALHSGFAFATILPQVFHGSTPRPGTACAGYIRLGQEKVMESYVFGYTPGPLAVMVASGWIAYLVTTKETKFPRWFALCTPLVTVAWVAAVGFLLMPWPWGMYFAGSFGTWILLVMNVAASCILWNVEGHAGGTKVT